MDTNAIRAMSAAGVPEHELDKARAELDILRMDKRDMDDYDDRWFALHDRVDRAEATIARVRRALDDELANLANDGARLSNSVVRRIEAALDGDQ